jgi:signal transduction histidine kinase
VTLVLGVLAVSLLIVYPLALPVLVLWIVVNRSLAAFERWRIGALLGAAVPASGPLPEQGSWHRRLWRGVLHADTWRAAAYHLLRLPVGILSFTLVVTVFALPLGFLILPLNLITAGAVFTSQAALATTFAASVVGVVLLPIIPTAVAALRDFDVALAAAMLGPSDRERLGQRVEQLSTTRSEMVDIAEAERRRIERDLHDGAGQQLVSLAMTLGMAREKMSTDPDNARVLIDEAHAEAKQALVGLRDIVRGISPAILTDRGLGAALSAVASRSAVPLALVVDVGERPDPVIEGIAYYVVCEAISNAIRHADASTIRVSVTREDDVLAIEVSDDGGGGADPARGTGLRGLAGRVAAVDGDLQVSSPDGGPTTVRVRLPAHAHDPAGDR